jgi:SRSO17 transposase
VTPKQLAAVEQRLDGFLSGVITPMGRSERKRWAEIYVRGLLLDGDRKSVQPIAQRIEGADEQGLNQFLNQSPWAVMEVQRRLAARLRENEHEPTFWAIDETSFPKAGEHSVGVARQYCGALGKIANCQVAVSLHWRQAAMSCPVSWRLHLPKSWCDDPARRRVAHVPDEIVYKTKTQQALELIGQALDWDLPQGVVLADSFYGNDYSFREALRGHPLAYAVSVEPTTVVWTADPSEVPFPPPASTGRPRRYPRLVDLPAAISLETLARQALTKDWRLVTWRKGTKGPQRSRFILIPVWAAHGWRKQAHPIRVREWLLVEWREETDAPSDYWLLWRPDRCPAPSLLTAVRWAKGRWPIEQDYRELKEELGLDHFEGRGWLGWHHHVTLVTLAFAFLRSEQHYAKKNFTCELTADPATPPGRSDPPVGPMPVVSQPLR